MIPLLYYKQLNKVKMKNLGKKLFLVALVTIGAIMLNSCTDNNEKLLENYNEQLIDKDNVEHPDDRD